VAVLPLLPLLLLLVLLLVLVLVLVLGCWVSLGRSWGRVAVARRRLSRRNQGEPVRAGQPGRAGQAGQAAAS
jgi:hypothetical protein